MNSRNWRDDDLGQLIKSGLQQIVSDTSPSPQVWLNIRREVTGQQDTERDPRRWPRLVVPSLPASIVLVLLAILVSMVSREMVGPNDRRVVQPTRQVLSSVPPPAMMTDDYSSELSPIALRTEVIAIRHALATAVNPEVPEKSSGSSGSHGGQDQSSTPMRRVSRALARD